MPTQPQRVRERVKFSLIHTPCCGALQCHINPRMPNYCSECGTQLFAMKLNKERILFSDDNATLTYQDPRG